MSNLKDAIDKNETRLEDNIRWLEEQRNGFFVTQEYKDLCNASRDVALAVLACGKDLLTLKSALDFDVDLYKDTRQRYHTTGSESVEVVPLGSTVVAAKGGSESLLRIDDRLVASKDKLIRKITEYNNLVRSFNGDKKFTWGNYRLEFVSMD